MQIIQIYEMWTNKILNQCHSATKKKKKKIQTSVRDGCPKNLIPKHWSTFMGFLTLQSAAACYSKTEATSLYIDTFLDIKSLVSKPSFREYPTIIIAILTSLQASTLSLVATSSVETYSWQDLRNLKGKNNSIYLSIALTDKRHTFLKRKGRTKQFHF